MSMRCASVQGTQPSSNNEWDKREAGKALCWSERDQVILNCIKPRSEEMDVAPQNYRRNVE